MLYKEVPDLGRVAPLPEWLELPRGRCSNGSPPCGVEHWYPLVSETRHYRMCELTARLLRNDAERIAESVSGQEPLLASIGYTWGLKVKAGYVGAREALQVLMKGAERMKNTNPAWPWDMREVRAKLRAAIQRGAE